MSNISMYAISSKGIDEARLAALRVSFGRALHRNEIAMRMDKFAPMTGRLPPVPAVKISRHRILGKHLQKFIFKARP